MFPRLCDELQSAVWIVEILALLDDWVSGEYITAVTEMDRVAEHLKR